MLDLGQYYWARIELKEETEVQVQEEKHVREGGKASKGQKGSA